MQVAKWGNSLAVRLPAAVVEALQLKPGDEIDVHVAGERAFGVARKPGSDGFPEPAAGLSREIAARFQVRPG